MTASERPAGTPQPFVSTPGAEVPRAPFLRVEMLGRFRVALGVREVPTDRWRLTKAKALVKLLALQPGARLHREQALDYLWPHLSPGAAANNLRRTLHASRRALASVAGDGASLLGLHDGMLALGTDRCPLVTDVDAFRAAAAATQADHDREAVRRAIERYTGDLLPEDRYETWTDAPRGELRRIYLDLCLDLARLEEAQGELPAAIQTLRRVVLAEAIHETAHQRLMRLYVRTGERHQALRQFQELEAVLRDDLNVEPDPASHELYRSLLHRAAGSAAPPSSATTAPLARRHNLPAPFTSLVGRQRELRDVRDLLDRARLVTLVGPGGCGKTRLAIEAAIALVDQRRDGVWLVELADLADPTLVPQTVADVLEVRQGPACPPLDMLADALASRDLCLVLDNCEHLAPACAQLAHTLLQACPGLAILATSRQALGIIGEVVYRVPPLAHPEAGNTAMPIEEMARLAAVQLFVERAQRARPVFELSPANADAVASICARLDGLPLPIELAAARGRSLGAEEIAAGLDDRFALLTSGSPTAPPRHQTLRALADSSYELLAPPERVLLRRLAVFAGEWTLEAARAVCSDADGPDQGMVMGESVVDLLGGLADKSWVLVEGGHAGVRYRLLETLREYGRERLRECAEAEELKRRRAGHFLTPLEPAAEQDAERSGPWLALTEREREVALGLAEGLSNRAIADSLAISRATVRIHVSRVLRKLRLSSRAQVAAWATRRGLLALSAEAPEPRGAALASDRLSIAGRPGHRPFGLCRRS